MRENKGRTKLDEKKAKGEARKRKKLQLSRKATQSDKQRSSGSGLVGAAAPA